MELSRVILQDRERLIISGPIGAIDLYVDHPARDPQGVALLGHSHPLLGGSPEDQVTSSIAQTLCDLGYVVLRPWFRGTGKTEGNHSNGAGEAEDMLVVHAYAAERFSGLPVLLCGFSFGAYVQSKLATKLVAQGQAPAEVILTSIALGIVRNVRFYDTDDLPVHSVLIHGTLDNRVPIGDVMRWAERQALPVVAIPDADHFFNGKLQLLCKAIQMTARLRTSVTSPA